MPSNKSKRAMTGGGSHKNNRAKNKKKAPPAVPAPAPDKRCQPVAATTVASAASGDAQTLPDVSSLEIAPKSPFFLKDPISSLAATSLLSPDAKPFEPPTGLTQAKKDLDYNGKESGDEGHEAKQRQKDTKIAITLDIENCKHPLQEEWTFWYFRNDSRQLWEHNQAPIYSVSFVEDFWSVYHHIVRVSELRAGCDYSLFKSGIKPMWEDRANKSGGRWLHSQDKRLRGDPLNEVWLNTMLFLIGGSAGREEYGVNGAVVSIRNKADKVGLWVSLSEGPNLREVGGKFKEAIGTQESVIFEAHQDSMQKTGSTIKATLRL